VARTTRKLGPCGAALASLAAAGLLPAAAPAVAEPALAPALVTVSNQSGSPEVDDYYRQRGNELIWLGGAARLRAARQLPAILRRAPLDGLANGPELARQVEAALDRSASLDSPVADDRLISAAWVQYVQALKAPVRGIAYGDPALVPLVPSAERVLDAAARAPSLATHVEAVAAVNPIYSGLREAAWKQSARRARLGLRPAADRRLAANLERARALPSSGRYIVVNAATAILTMYRDGEAQDSMKVVVGKPDTPTPMLAGTIHSVTFNPYWNIPADVARRNIVPFVLKYGTVVLRDMHYEVVSDFSDRAKVLNPGMVDWKAVAAGKRDVLIRQLPGPGNSMGAIKFGFANELGIYLHDTPKKELFAEAKRNFSLGCVRVEDARRLARWFLGSEPAVPSDEPEQYVHLARGVPVYLTYLTAVPEGERLTFAEDVYGRDKTRAAPAKVELATAFTR